MKSKISFLIISLTLCFIFTSCGCDTNKTNVVNNSSQTDRIQSDSSKQTTNDISSYQTSDNVDEIVSSYKPPAEVLNIDLSKDDPSNDDIMFSYDSKGRISNCRYTTDGIEYNQIYNYDDAEKKVTITTYSNSIVVDEKIIDLSDYSNNGFFDIVDGYYINIIYNTEDNSSWKQLYLDYIDKYVSEYGDNEDYYNLIFVNDDEIPELIICGQSHITSTYFCWVYNDKLLQLNLNWAGSDGVTYIERNALLRDCGNWQGNGQDTIYNFDGKDINIISSGKFDHTLDSFTWENKSVSESEYKQCMKSVFDTTKAKSAIDNYYTKDEIITAIKNY